MQGTIEDERLMSAISAALQRTPSEREGFLRHVCAGDSELFNEAFQMVKAEEKMGSFLLHPMIAVKEFPRPFQAGDVILERFEIIREIGEGGMGTVYEAFDRKRGLRIAIKAAKPGFQRLLSPELEGALSVRHPNVCLVNEIYTTLTDLGEIDFITMELLEGEVLSAYLKRRDKLPDGEALTIARQLCAGLSAAHRSGILHRDLKSANIILCPPSVNGERRAVITDFGLSGAATESDDLAGTPQYMAPELWQGVKTSKASDIYALGVVLYEMVADPESKAAVEADEWRPDTKRLSKSWADTVARCTAASPAARPKDAGEVLAQLEKRPSRWLLLLVLPLLALLALCFPQVRTRAHDRIWPPPNVRLAILPPAASGPALDLAGGVLQDVANRISHLKSGTRLVEVISPAEARNIHVLSSEQARASHATHALQTSMVQNGADLLVKGSLVDLATMTKIGEISGSYSPPTWGEIPEALAGTVSSGLGLQGKLNAEPLSPAATSPYDRGLQALAQDGPASQQAIPFFRDASRLDARSPLPLAGLVEAEVKAFDNTKDSSWLNKAQEHLRAAEAINPDSVSVHFAAGTVNEVHSEYEKARGQYLRVLGIEPKNVEAVIRIARVYDKLDMAEEAEETYRKAIELDPAFYKPHESLGVFYYYRGKYSQAVDEFRKVIGLAPLIDVAYSNLAGSLQNLGQFAEAERAYVASLKVRETAAGLNNMGTLLASENRDGEAVGYYERALLANPYQPVYLLNSGDSNRRLGRKMKAIANYREGRRLARIELNQNPRDAYTRALFAYFSARLDLSDRADDDINQALRFAPNNNRVILRAVLTYEVLGLRDKALAALHGATVQLLAEVNREPDLADFSRDPRYKQLVVDISKGDH